MKKEIEELKAKLNIAQKNTNNIEIFKERDEYKETANKYLELSRELGEEVIILRNQLDKFLHYKK
jgi:hypothetical protein